MDHSSPSKNKLGSSHDFDGVWSPLSREDKAMDGSLRLDPTLGPDALGILTYANGRFAAQIMKRDRKSAVNAGLAGGK